LNWMAPRRFLGLTCAVSVLGLLGLFIPVPALAVAACFVTGLGFANIFPLIFSTAIDAMPKYANPISGLMVTAIVGGAILPPVMGMVADRSSVLIGFLVPLAAVVYICAVGLLAKPKTA